MFFEIVCVCYNPSKTWILGCISNDSGSTSGGLSWLIISHDVPPKMLWTMYSGSAMLKWFSLLVSNLIYTNGVSGNGECTCRQQDPSNKKGMASFLDSSQILEFLTSKSTLGGSLILCNLYLGLKCANCPFALCIRSTWESCKLWMAVYCPYFVPMDACQYLHSGVHRWFFIVIQCASWDI